MNEEGEKMLPTRQLTRVQEARFQYIFGICLLLIPWLFIGLTWLVVSTAVHPLFWSLLFMWLFWAYAIIGALIILPFHVRWAYRQGVFDAAPLPPEISRDKM